MDGYDPADVAHSVPLLVVCGLASSQDVSLPGGVESVDVGLRISSDLPLIDSPRSQILLNYLKDIDTQDISWNKREYAGRPKYKVKVVGREYTLPSHHALLQAPRTPSFGNVGSVPPRPNLHSPLSPLSPGSAIFPDGLLDPQWIKRHQDIIPSAFISFYVLTSDRTLSTLHDNQLKIDINNVKSILEQSGYKSRLIIALLSETSDIQTLDTEDRISNIRRGTGLDSKTSLFFLPAQNSTVDLQNFIKTITTAIYPQCLEYYRDLSKHSRRKRGRSVIPPPSAPPTSGTSQTLSMQGWNVRYDFKLGVFAEFRQEMDTAARFFESAYEGLLGADVLETIASWSSRWNEARLLADICSIRILRCLLWTGSTTTAVRRWQLHRDKMQDFVDRRGKGSLTYGWEAWEGRWATVMAELIQKAEIPDFFSQTPSFYLFPEKTISITERLQPWFYLHHPGYWYRLASLHQMARRNLALAIPEEEREIPPPNTIRRNHESYLCPEPHEEYPISGNTGVNHFSLILDSLNKGIQEFEQKGQTRFAETLKLQAANECIKLEAWDDALQILRPLWHQMSFRTEGWLSVVEEVGWALRKVAAHTGDGASILSVDWELLNKDFTYHSGWHYDLKQSLAGIANIKTKPAVILHDYDVHSFLSAAFAFEYSEGQVGDICSSQLAVTSSALSSSAPVTANEIKIEFEGSIRNIIIRHDPSILVDEPGSGRIVYTKLHLDETSTGKDGLQTLIGIDNLIIRPGKRIFQLEHLPRESGEARATAVTFEFSSSTFQLSYIHMLKPTSVPDTWWGTSKAKKKLSRANVASIHLRPKPPKVELRFTGAQAQYYTNERILLQLEIFNEEDCDSIAHLDVEISGENSPPIILKHISPSDEPSPSSIEMSQNGSRIDLGRIASSRSITVEILLAAVDFPAIYDLVAKTAYHLVSDLDTPIFRETTLEFEVISPFEANYDFSPRICPDSWPSFFSHTDISKGVDESEANIAHGIAQKWCLVAKYASFATEELIVKNINLKVLGVSGGILARAANAEGLPPEGIHLSPNSLEEARFGVSVQKVSLDDRSTATLDLSLVIDWHRNSNASDLNTTIVAVPRLLVSSSEPRVLASVTYPTTLSMIFYDITIENPSNHFLTFSLTMEPSEQFALSGTKQATLQLVPLSRRTERFRLLPYVRGEWIGPIKVTIKDRYFQKILKVIPTDGMRLEKDGILVWVPPQNESQD